VRLRQHRAGRTCRGCAGLAVGAVDLDDLDAPPTQEAGQSDPIGTGSFHTDLGHLTEPLEPGEQCLVAGSVCWERLGADQPAQRIKRGSDVGVEVSVDATGDTGRGFYDGHGHPFFLNC
jgi:hypothetical protein